MICKYCGASLEENTRVCPACGQSVEESAPVESAPVQSEAAVPEEPVAVVAPAPEEAVAPAPKKKSKTVLLAVIAAIVVVVAVVVIFFGSTIANAFAKLTKSPEDYYGSLEYKNISVALQTAQENTVDVNDMKLSGDVTLNVTQQGKAVLKEMGFDLEQYVTADTAKISGNLNAKDGLQSVDAAVYVGETQLADASAVLDMTAGQVFAKIPLIGDQFLQLDISEEVEDFAQLSDMAPSQEMTDDLLELSDKYAKFALNHLPAFQKSSDTLEVNGISAKYTLLSCDVDTQNATEFAKVLLTELRDSGDLEQFVTKYADYFAQLSGVSADEITNEVLDSLDEMLRDLNNVSGGTPQPLFTYSAWVDGAGRIMAREIKADGEVVVGLYNARKGTDMGTCLEVSGLLKVEGKGKISASRVIAQGEYNLSYYDDGEEMDWLTLKVAKLDLDGLVKGKLDVDMSVQLHDDTPDAESQMVTVIKPFALTLKATGDAKAVNLELGVAENDEALATLTFDVKQEKGQAVTKPADALSAEAYSQTINAQQLMQDLSAKLEEAGVSEEALNELTGAIQ